MRFSFLKKLVGVGALLLLAEASPLPFSFSVAQAFDPVAGKKVFIRCKNCHTVEKKGVHVIGPNLWGIIGRQAGKKEDYRYSEAMKKFDKKWDVKTLDAYLAKPSALVPGTRMSFVGLRDAKQRADVIAYLNKKTDKPIQLTRQKAEKKADAKSKTQKSQSSSQVRVAKRSSLLPAGVGRNETEAYCSACHSLRLIIQQGLNRADWSELLDWMIEEQEMQPMRSADRAKVLGYLARHFNRKRPNFKKP